jgi:dihydrolipoamide dehydrogenase
MKEFDLIVIGAGSGLDVAAAAANRDMNVAVVDDGPLGGTCLNRGCIPSKMLLHRADVAAAIRNAEQFGIDASIDDVDFAGMIREINESVAEDSDGIERGIEASDQHTLYRTRAQFVDERTLDVGENTIRGERIVIAAGTRPAVPSIDSLGGVDYWTSTDALNPETHPDHLVIVGGGYIAAELAHFYGTFGSEVTIIGRREVLLPDHEPDISARYAEIDEEISAAFTDSYAERYDVHTGYEATAVSENGEAVTVHAVGPNGDDIMVSGDQLLLAAGRRPNSDTMDLDTAGVATDGRGFIETNKYLETTAENVWALGDITGNYLFKHAANHDASYVVTNALGDAEHRHAVDYTAMPYSVFASPQVAGVGQTEQELRAGDMEYAVGTYSYSDTAMGSALKEENGFVKVLADPQNGAILGCHIIGPHASILIQEVVVAMTSEPGTVGDIRNAIHVHPALSEVVHRAFSGHFDIPE